MKLEDVICRKYEIVDGVVNVDGDVYFFDSGLDELDKIPWKFGVVTGSFNCSSCFLKTLENSPCTVGGSFDCSDNKLESLKYSPTIVGINFECNENIIKSLKHCPSHVGSFDCSWNKLTSLKYCPTVDNDFHCDSNQLRSLKWLPSVIPGKFSCSNNPLGTLNGLPLEILQKTDGLNDYDDLFEEFRIPKEMVKAVEKLFEFKKKYVPPKRSIKDRLENI